MDDQTRLYLPHAPPMRWIHHLLESDEYSATAEACFTEEDFAVQDGWVIESALVECVAQTTAASLARQKLAGTSSDDAAVPGLLAAIHEFAFYQAVRCNITLRIHIRERLRLGNMRRVHGLVSSGDQVLAEGEISVYG